MAPAICLIAGKADQIILNKNYGHLTYDAAAEPLTSEHYFDIASLTKTFCTTLLCMLAYQEQKLLLDTKVNSFFAHLSKEHNYTVKQLLQHTSGLKDWLPLYQNITPHTSVIDINRRGGVSPPTKVIELISQDGLNPINNGGRIYSDLNFILLGFILEKIYQKSLDQLFDEKIVQAWKLEGIQFNKISLDPHLRGDDKPQLNNSHIVPTEICPWRKRLLQGEVDDENCFALGGVAGHAGLFAQSGAVLNIVQKIIESYCDRSLVRLRRIEMTSCASDEMTKKFIQPATWDCFVNTAEQYFLGWDRPSLNHSLSGKYFSQNSIGHLAFTGCSFWIDLENFHYIVVLANRIHPERGAKKVFNDFRFNIHNLIFEELFC